jgi:hypothetical protein
VYYFADPSQPGAIRDLRRLDIKVTAANNAFMTGVGTLTRMINTGALVVVASKCPHLIEEAEQLVYRPPDNGEPSESATKAPTTPSTRCVTWPWVSCVDAVHWTGATRAIMCRQIEIQSK